MEFESNIAIWNTGIFFCAFISCERLVRHPASSSNACHLVHLMYTVVPLLVAILNRGHPL